MSEDEKRAIMGAVLLEVEEAKAALALLRAKAEQWSRLHEKVSHLLARMRRDGAQMESAAAETRKDILANREAITAVMDFNAVLALDAELDAAIARLKKAEAVKKDLFSA